MLEQIVPYNMAMTGASGAYAAGSQWVSSFNDLPDTIDGMVCHLAGILFDLEYSPAYTTAPTIYGHNSIVNQLAISDGVNQRLDVLGFNGLRSHEIFETGDVSTPDPDTNSATGNRVRLQRVWLPGPANFNQNDFMLPVPCVKGGEVRGTWNALTGLSADTTAITLNRFTMVALLALRPDEFRIPVLFERKTSQLNSTNQPIQGRGAYSHLGLTKTTYAAFAAGELGNISVDTGKGIKGGIPIPAAVLDGVNQFLTSRSQFTKIRGEFATATVDNEKTVNLGTPTALVATDATHASIVTSPPNGRLTKLTVEGSNIKPNWTGTQTTVLAHYGRVLEQSSQAVASMILRGCEQLDKEYIPGNSKIATDSKTMYRGNKQASMPYKYKLSKKEG